MKKAVDINERTLKQEKQGFLKMCACLEGITNAIRVILTIFTPLAFVCGILAITGVYVPEGVTDATAYFIEYMAISVVSVGFMITFNFAGKIFSTLKNSETPFCYDAADKMKGAGIALVGTGVAAFAINLTALIMERSGNMLLADMTYLPDFDSMAFGVFLIVLAYVFNYGCKLQQEHDETL